MHRIILIVMGVAVCSVVAVLVVHGSRQTKSVPLEPQAARTPARVVEAAKGDVVQVAGPAVTTAALPVAVATRPPPQPVATVTDPAMPADMAFTKPLAPDANPAVAAIAAAHKGGAGFEKLSHLAPVPAFSPADYQRDPQAYCAQVVPGRIHQSAEPGPDVPPLRYAGGSDLAVKLGGTCRFGVVTRPGAPASAMAIGLGAFANGLTSITVQADEQGEAWFDYHATAGTIGAVTVQVASPVASGQYSFQITVEGPDDRTAAH